MAVRTEPADLPNGEAPRLMRAREAAAYLSLSVSQIYALMAGGGLPTCRIAGSVRIDRSRLDEFLDGQRREAQ